MTRDDIICMAREAGFDPHDMSADFTCNLTDIERFAALVAAHEREACVEIVRDNTDNDGLCCADDLLAAIRARGNV